MASTSSDIESKISLPEPKMKRGATHVLSVGRLEHEAILREAPGDLSQFTISHASDYRELWSLSKGSQYQAVVFHNSLCSFELEEAARLVRSRWPAAKIVIIRSGEISLDDPLYDYRLAPHTNPSTLISVLSELTRRSKGRTRQNAA
ncbi:hypothetical protein [Occallatibacter riparius]|uniref:Uncharacterized protein n=1 Tax=Occallatibacter riparius TaxID=1002689 RepID=A0A9J7BR29_9BACT|nr:hypothetical protein [Occallatibacter riparius]UWZ85033.1 hypothetical protein MOP44_03595 [Occallatibacter riparius]